MNALSVMHATLVLCPAESGERVAHCTEQNNPKRFEADSDPRGHLWATWGVYLCAGQPPLADIILSHPPDPT